MFKAENTAIPGIDNLSDLRPKIDRIRDDLPERVQGLGLGLFMLRFGFRVAGEQVELDSSSLSP